jgi:hypothetical protein
MLNKGAWEWVPVEARILREAGSASDSVVIRRRQRDVLTKSLVQISRGGRYDEVISTGNLNR